MRNYILNKNRIRKKRAFRVRKSVRGTAEKPRLSVNKSNQHIYVQIIDDVEQKTLGAISTLSKQFRGSPQNKETAKKLGTSIAEIATKLGIKEVVFDRGRFKYHGILKELADAAREKGLAF